MNLKNITDGMLHQSNLSNAKQERELLTRVLHHLRETERRRLFSKYKRGSLYEYAMKDLKYSSDQAGRRIAAMRLLKDMPAAEDKINSGELNLTNAALAQKLFQNEERAGSPLDVQEKTEILSKLENKTTREAEKIVYEIRPEMKPKAADLNFDKIEDESLREKLKQVLGLYAHSHPNMTPNELLHKLCDNEIEKRSKSPCAPKVDSKAEIKRQVWRRDQGKCTQCKSTHAIEDEHIIPKAMGGEYTLENICLLCRSCNQRSAIEFYGMGKMDPFLNEPVRPYGSGVTLSELWRRHGLQNQLVH